VAAVCAAIAVAVGSACGNPTHSGDGTQIRLRNSSTFDITSVTFRPGEAKLEFARIDAGQVTNYVAVSSAYRYGYLDVTVQGERRVLQPIDYVGESVIGEGRFTYVITIEPGTLNPGVTLVKDD
jgi:hypothetical protein